jgi:hypothetical protein
VDELFVEPTSRLVVAANIVPNRRRIAQLSAANITRIASTITGTCLIVVNFIVLFTCGRPSTKKINKMKFLLQSSCHSHGGEAKYVIVVGRCTFDVPWTDSFQVEHSRVSMRLTSNSVASRTSHVQRLLPVVFFFFFFLAVVVAAPSSTVLPVNSNYGTDVTSLRPSDWLVLGFFDQSHLCVYTTTFDPLEYDYSALPMFFELQFLLLSSLEMN